LRKTHEKVKTGILVPIEAPIMACPIVPVSKPDGSVRICGDYSVTANKYIDPEQYILPTLEELSTNMANCTVFSKLDLKNAYLQLINFISEIYNDIHHTWILQLYSALLGSAVATGERFNSSIIV
jgi:hypothetical protein